MNEHMEEILQELSSMIDHSHQTQYKSHITAIKTNIINKRSSDTTSLIQNQGPFKIDVITNQMSDYISTQTDSDKQKNINVITQLFKEFEAIYTTIENNNPDMLTILTDFYNNYLGNLIPVYIDDNLHTYALIYNTTSKSTKSLIQLRDSTGGLTSTSYFLKIPFKQKKSIDTHREKLYNDYKHIFDFDIFTTNTTPPRPVLCKYAHSIYHFGASFKNKHYKKNIDANTLPSLTSLTDDDKLKGVSIMNRQNAIITQGIYNNISQYSVNKQSTSKSKSTSVYSFVTQNGSTRDFTTDLKAIIANWCSQKVINILQQKRISTDVSSYAFTIDVPQQTRLKSILDSIKNVYKYTITTILKNIHSINYGYNVDQVDIDIVDKNVIDDIEHPINFIKYWCKAIKYSIILHADYPIVTKDGIRHTGSQYEELITDLNTYIAKLEKNYATFNTNINNVLTAYIENKPLSYTQKSDAVSFNNDARIIEHIVNLIYTNNFSVDDQQFKKSITALIQYNIKSPDNLENDLCKLFQIKEMNYNILKKILDIIFKKNRDDFIALVYNELQKKLFDTDVMHITEDYIKKTCYTRVTEGCFINDSLNFIKEYIIKLINTNSTATRIQRLPNFAINDICSICQCNSLYNHCFIDKDKKLIQTSTGQQNILSSSKHNETAFDVSIFLMLNFSLANKSINPPNNPYINISDLKKIYYKLHAYKSHLLNISVINEYKISIHDKSYEKNINKYITNIVKYNMKTSYTIDDLENELSYYLSSFYNVDNESDESDDDVDDVDDDDESIKMYTSILKLSNTNKLKLIKLKNNINYLVRYLNESIRTGLDINIHSIYSTITNINISENDKVHAYQTRLADIIHILERSNATSVIGTLEYIDSMAKLGLSEIPCHMRRIAHDDLYLYYLVMDELFIPTLITNIPNDKWKASDEINEYISALTSKEPQTINSIDEYNKLLKSKIKATSTYVHNKDLTRDQVIDNIHELSKYDRNNETEKLIIQTIQQLSKVLDTEIKNYNESLNNIFKSDT
jgi:hypothetical protein